MDSLHLGIITLLRSALNREKLTLPDSFHLADALGLIQYHQLIGLALQGATLCGIPKNDPTIVKMTLSFCQTLQQSRRQMEKLEEIYGLFDDANIDYLPVKGAVIKPLFPKPEYRLMGDADILIHPEQYPQIQKLMTQAGMTHTGETDYELVWSCPNLTLELHKRLIATHNKDYHAYYGDGWPSFCQKGPGASYRLRNEDHYIYLLVHFAKHYREGSISAKNICDFWVCKNAWADMDEAYITGQLKKLKLLKFYRNIEDLLAAWFRGAEFTHAAELITQVAFRGAIYSHEESERVSTVLKMQKQNDSLAGNKLFWLLKRLFPPIRIMECSHPVLKKFPILLPFFWIARLCRMALRDRQRVKQGISNMKEVSHLDNDALSYYEAQLHAVGLDFNFSE